MVLINRQKKYKIIKGDKLNEIFTHKIMTNSLTYLISQEMSLFLNYLQRKITSRKLN